MTPVCHPSSLQVKEGFHQEFKVMKFSYKESETGPVVKSSYSGAEPPQKNSTQPVNSSSRESSALISALASLRQED